MFLNFVLRGFTLVAKFILTLFIAKQSTNQLLGEYTVFLTTVTICIYFLGFEFYSYSQREILKSELSDYTSLIKQQFVFHLISYSFLLPILYFGIVNIIDDFILYFYAILILEHLNQELYRLLVVVKKPLQATINNFIRAGLWVIIFILYFFVVNADLTLQGLFTFWLFGQLFSLLYSWFQFKEFLLGFFNWREIRWNWILNGLKISFVFFVSGMIQKIVEYSERYFLKEISGEEAVGIYFFFYSIAYLPFTFFSSVLIINFLPEIISSYSKKSGNFRKIRNEFIRSTLFFCLLFIPICILAFYLIVNFVVVKSSYLSNTIVFWGLLGASVLTIVSEILYIELYIRHKDRLIFLSFLLTLAVHLILNYSLISSFGLYGAVIAKVGVVLFMLFCRYVFVKKYC